MKNLSQTISPLVGLTPELAKLAARTTEPGTPCRPWAATGGAHDLRVVAVIPALNEVDTIAKAVAGALAHVQRVLVADNGSTDGTAKAAAAAGAEVVPAPRRGYGSACLAVLEVLAAEPTPPDAVLFMDADGSDDASQIPRLLAPIASGQADFVLGSRTQGPAEAGALTTPQRLGSWILSAWLKYRYGVKASDLGPFRVLRYDALRRLAMDDRDFGWTIQMQARAATAEAGIRYQEIAVPYFRRQSGKSKISGTLRGSWQAGSTILKTAWRERHWQPGPTAHVAVLAKMPEPGRVKTRLAAGIGEAAATQIHERMLRHTLRRVAALPHTFWWDASSKKVGNAKDWDATRVRTAYGSWRRYERQGGGDLGARIDAALQDAFDRGYDAAMVVGSDCPDLTAQDLEDASRKLLDREADVVLGPSEDGGYWLLGVHRSAWTDDQTRRLTKGIDWGTETVLAQTRDAIQAAGLRYHELRWLNDVDTLETLPVWERHDPSPPLSSLIQPSDAILERTPEFPH